MMQVTAGPAAGSFGVVVALGAAQAVAWASSYYLPAVLAAPAGFGRRVGMISLSARAIGAIAPLAPGLMVEHFGSSALWISALASISAAFRLLLLRAAQIT